MRIQLIPVKDFIRHGREYIFILLHFFLLDVVIVFVNIFIVSVVLVIKTITEEGAV